MRIDRFQALGPHGFHQVSYADWGDRDNPHVVICVHGLTRNCRDFDDLARALSTRCRVVCPDVAGRGRSDWLRHKDDYNYPVYLADMAALIARVTERPEAAPAVAVDWVGTSMGGLIGMLLAAQPASPFRRLVLNDVGPWIPKAALQRIGTYVGLDPHFPTLDAMEAQVRAVSAPFGPLTDAQWRHLTEHVARQLDDGQWAFRYDPGIAKPFRSGALGDVDLWPFYDAIRTPTLLLRGATSDLLTADTAREMTQRGPRPRCIEFAGVGHAPMLMSGDQIETVRSFLLD